MIALLAIFNISNFAKGVHFLLDRKGNTTQLARKWTCFAKKKCVLESLFLLLFLIVMMFYCDLTTFRTCVVECPSSLLLLFSVISLYVRHSQTIKHLKHAIKTTCESMQLAITCPGKIYLTYQHTFIRLF